MALALLDAGYLVRGSLRSLSKADHVRKTLAAASASGHAENLEFVALDLTRDEGWREAAQGCRYLVHVASPFTLEMPKDKDEMIRPAVEGTRRALISALNAGVERIVLTSSAAAVTYGHPPSRAEPFTDADWSKTEGFDVTTYTESKTRAELEAWSVMEAAGRRQDLATINATLILGPLLDDDPGTSAMLVGRLLNGSIPAAPRFFIEMIDVRDVAALHVAAMETPAAGGRRFLCSAGSLSLFQAAEVLRPAFPARRWKLPMLELPDWFVRIFSFVDRETRDNIHSLGVRRQLDSRAAEALLGRDFIAAPEALLATARSLVERGLV